jgi:hypothetical protein
MDRKVEHCADPVATLQHFQIRLGYEVTFMMKSMAAVLHVAYLCSSATYCNLIYILTSDTWQVTLTFNDQVLPPQGSEPSL